MKHSSNVVKDLKSILGYISHSVGIDAINFDIASPFLRDQISKDIVQLKKYVPNNSTPRAMDLSCGKGLLSAALVRSGWDVIGCDVMRPASDQLEINEVGWQVRFWNSLTAADIKQRNRFFFYQTKSVAALSGTFDGIIGYAVYEHIPPEDRTEWLLEAHRLLRPGGAFLVAHCPRPESPTEHLARRLGVPAHEFLIATDDLVSHVTSVGFVVESVWLNDHIPSFLPWGPNWMKRAYLRAQDGPLKFLEQFVGWATSSRWAHHTNLIAVKL